MTRYLIVAHQTAESPELRRLVGRLSREGPDAAFTLLVPATPIEHLGGWTEGEAQAVAREAGERARAVLESAGARVDEVMVGDGNPVYAVKDAFYEGTWDHVIVSTFSRRMSRWLRMDVVRRLARDLDVPVTHVSAEVVRSG